jgi:hypothetical protein
MNVQAADLEMSRFSYGGWDRELRVIISGKLQSRLRVLPSLINLKRHNVSVVTGVETKNPA